MLFNSFEFIFIFLPLTLFIFSKLRAKNINSALYWLIISSLAFYAWWYPPFLIILLISTVTNYLFGSLLNYHHKAPYKKAILILGLSFNIGLICYYKYIDFLITNLNLAFHTDYPLQNPILPLAISFFTFQKISYLIDGYKEGRFRYSFSEYCFFVCFFPQLIAGPIVQHKDIIPQISKLNTNARLIHIGLCYFILGLAKKVIIADHCAQYANPIFSAASQGTVLSFSEAWLGALAYTMQLYFDFSGYSDMALGLGRMFNIRLPINFNSPYKACNIIDFWRRWHITLSYFLRHYLYIPLGGNRKGVMRQFLNLFLTMLIGGLWHGANWTFVIWGGMHGFYLTCNHAWQLITQRSRILQYVAKLCLNRLTSTLLTFLLVVIAWVYFRADSITQANSIIQSMLGAHGISVMKSLASIIDPLRLAEYHIYCDGLFPNILVDAKSGCGLIASILLVAFLFPNSHQLMMRYQSHKTDSFSGTSILAVNKSLVSGIIIGILGAISVLFISKANEFLYFQF